MEKKMETTIFCMPLDKFPIMSTDLVPLPIKVWHTDFPESLLSLQQSMLDCCGCIWVVVKIMVLF